MKFSLRKWLKVTSSKGKISMKRSKSDWNNLLDECERSDLAQSVFCKQKGINTSTFSAIKSKYKKKRSSELNSPEIKNVPNNNSFVPVKIIEREIQRNPIFSFKISNVCLEFESRPDPIWVANIIREL